MPLDMRLKRIVDWLRAIAVLLGVILCTMIGDYILDIGTAKP